MMIHIKNNAILVLNQITKHTSPSGVPKSVWISK